MQLYIEVFQMRVDGGVGNLPPVGNLAVIGTLRQQVERFLPARKVV